MIELDAISEFVKNQGVGISVWHDYHDGVWAGLNSGPDLWIQLKYGLIIQGGTINMYKDDSVKGNEYGSSSADQPYIIFRAHLSAPDCLRRLGVMLEAVR